MDKIEEENQSKTQKNKTQKNKKKTKKARKVKLSKVTILAGFVTGFSYFCAELNKF